MLIVDESFAGRQVSLSVGEVLELRLGENPTTGFRWTVASDGRPACVVIADAYRAAPGPPGHAGVHRWEIRGLQPGLCNFVLQYRRTFDPDAPAVRSFAFHIRVG